MKKSFVIIFWLCVSCSPGSQELTQKGKELLDSEEYDQALGYLSRAVETDPENAEAHNAQAVAYFALGKFSST